MVGSAALVLLVTRVGKYTAMWGAVVPLVMPSTFLVAGIGGDLGSSPLHAQYQSYPISQTKMLTHDENGSKFNIWWFLFAMLP